jgi:aminoglycoside phosphotransferase (APT) family kinase protein
MGATVDDVAAALVELSRLHAQYWGRQGARELGWVPVRAAPERSRRLAAAYRLLHKRFLDRSGERLSSDAIHVIERFDAVVRPWLSAEELPRTLMHGDYRVENLIFGQDSRARPVTVLDWQNLGIGPGASDVAYLIGGSLPTETRRDNEAELARLYLDALAGHGIEVTVGAFRSSYAVNALAGLHMAVVSAMLVDGGSGSDDLFVIMAERHSAHARDLDALGALS